MREAYLDYRGGGSRAASEKKLNRFLHLSDRFFRTYPNPFLGYDPLFIPPSKTYDSRTQHKVLYFKMQRLLALKESLEQKLANLEEGDPAVDKFSNYLRDCETKIKDLEKRIEKLETSNLPG